MKRPVSVIERLAYTFSRLAAIRCPMWVKSASLTFRRRLPVCPQDQTFWHVSNGPESDNQCVYSITSSASNCIDRRNDEAKRLEVFKLMTNSNLVARVTGMSAGSSPFKMRAARVNLLFHP